VDRDEVRATRAVAAIIAVVSAARLLLAGTLGLGVDESYAVSVSRGLALSYFDHPPLSFWIPGVLARVTGSESALPVRAPFILFGAVSAWLLYRLGVRLFGLPAGAIGLLLYLFAPFFLVAAGGWVLPDGPLDCFLLAAALALTHPLFDRECTHPTRWWLLAGVMLGGAMLSKYHAFLFGAGLLLFLATTRDARTWLRRPAPYAAALIAFAYFIPVVIWNARHDWASFRFQLSRGAGAHGAPLTAFLQAIGGQAGYLTPWIWIPLVIVLARACARGPRDVRAWYLACLAIVPVALFSLAALRGDPGLPHWPMPGYLFAFPLLGAAAARALTTRPVLVVRWIAVSAVATMLLLDVAAMHVATRWIARVEPAWFTRGDPAFDLRDWRGLRAAADSLALFRDPGTFVAPVSWVQGGKIAYALGPTVPVVVLNEHPHQFLYLRDPSTLAGHDAVIVMRADPRTDTTAAAYAPYFASLERIKRIPIILAGTHAFDLLLFRARGFRPPYPTDQPR
jgi:hypothetical protein